MRFLFYCYYYYSAYLLLWHHKLMLRCGCSLAWLGTRPCINYKPIYPWQTVDVRELHGGCRPTDRLDTLLGRSFWLLLLLLYEFSHDLGSKGIHNHQHRACKRRFFLPFLPFLSFSTPSEYLLEGKKEARRRRRRMMKMLFGCFSNGPTWLVECA